jgi:hypothetical protein
MKMKNENNNLRDEYDFSNMKSLGKGKYASKYRKGTNIIHLDSDVAAVFNNDKSVNEALRTLINIAKKRVPSS